MGKSNHFGILKVYWSVLNLCFDHTQETFSPNSQFLFIKICLPQVIGYLYISLIKLWLQIILSHAMHHVTHKPIQLSSVLYNTFLNVNQIVYHHSMLCPINHMYSHHVCKMEYWQDMKKKDSLAGLSYINVICTNILQLYKHFYNSKQGISCTLNSMVTISLPILNVSIKKKF